MPEDSNPQVEIIGAATTPRLSEEGIAYQKGLLADAKWREEFPAQAAALRASLDNALAATGQDREPPQDERSAAQRLHDQRMGVTPRTADQYGDVPPTYRDFAAALSLPSDLARVVVNDALSSDNKGDAAAMLGDKYEDTLKAAQAA